MSFTTLGLSEPILRAVTQEGYTTPTPIQQQSIPVILSGKDILAAAQTGTGKTAGFTLPLLELLTRSKTPGKAPRVLILAPTRELAAQVGESVRTYGRHLPFRTAIIFGGVNMRPQITALRQGVDIIIATPGRLLDHVNQRNIDLSHIETLVLDEADRMLDMGFIQDIKKILSLMPKKRQNLLFSATFSAPIKKLSESLLNAPTIVEVARRNTTATQVSQVVHPVDRERKRELLTHLITSQEWQQALVFTRTKHGANRLCEQLSKDGISSAAIHGNKSQGARTRALSDFKEGRVRILVATDIAARGIDIDMLSHVVNFELPNVPEDYVHRIGRTGRAGNDGSAISLVCVDEHELLRNIERVIKNDITKTVIKAFAPDPSIKAEPIRQKSGHQKPARHTPRRNSSSQGRARQAYR